MALPASGTIYLVSSSAGMTSANVVKLAVQDFFDPYEALSEVFPSDLNGLLNVAFGQASGEMTAFYGFPDTSAISAPTGQSASINATRVQLSWTNVANLVYDVWRSKAPMALDAYTKLATGVTSPLLDTAVNTTSSTGKVNSSMYYRIYARSVGSFKHISNYTFVGVVGSTPDYPV